MDLSLPGNTFFRLFSQAAAYDSQERGSEAEAAGRLWLAFGVRKDNITLENVSNDTAGNAIGVAEMAGPGPFVLVTSAFHMPRAVISVKKAGIAVLPASTDFRAKRTPFPLTDFLPDTWKLECSGMALHEYIGMLYYILV